MTYEQYMLPIILANLVAVVVMLSSYNFPRFMRFIWGLIFIAAGIVNLITVYNAPGIYVDSFGPAAIERYQEIIYGPFSKQPAVYVTLIAVGQILVGALIWSRGFWYYLGLTGGVIFLLAIAPLGVGSAFPCTIILAFGLIFMMRKRRRKSLFGI
ncbi:MAG: hypothetical protein K9H65_05970 [Bacteroidales bacterium]|nr:hypothetical protein [Bacteroidales bacterium]